MSKIQNGPTNLFLITHYKKKKSGQSQKHWYDTNTRKRQDSKSILNTNNKKTNTFQRFFHKV